MMPPIHSKIISLVIAASLFIHPAWASVGHPLPRNHPYSMNYPSKDLRFMEQALAERLVASERRPEQEAVLLAARLKDLAAAATSLEEATSLYHARRYREAWGKIAPLLDIHPGDGGMRELAIKIKLHLGHKYEAMHMAEEFSILDPLNPRAWYTLSFVHLMLMNFSEGIKASSKVLRLNVSEVPEIFGLRARMLVHRWERRTVNEDMRDLDLAIQSAREWIRRQGAIPESHGFLSHIYHLRGKLREAIREREREVALLGKYIDFGAVARNRDRFILAQNNLNSLYEKYSRFTSQVVSDEFLSSYERREQSRRKGSLRAEQTLFAEHLAQTDGMGKIHPLIREARRTVRMTDEPHNVGDWEEDPSEPAPAAASGPIFMQAKVQQKLSEGKFARLHMGSRTLPQTLEVIEDYVSLPAGYAGHSARVTKDEFGAAVSIDVAGGPDVGRLVMDLPRLEVRNSENHLVAVYSVHYDFVRKTKMQKAVDYARKLKARVVATHRRLERTSAKGFGMETSVGSQTIDIPEPLGQALIRKLSKLYKGSVLSAEVEIAPEPKEIWIGVYPPSLEDEDAPTPLHVLAHFGITPRPSKSLTYDVHKIPPADRTPRRIPLSEGRSGRQRRSLTSTDQTLDELTADARDLISGKSPVKNPGLAEFESVLPLLHEIYQEIPVSLAPDEHRFMILKALGMSLASSASILGLSPRYQASFLATLR